MTARRISRSPAWREAYRKYLQSEEWFARKQAYFGTHPRSCKPCWDDWNETYKGVPDEDRPTGMLFEPVDLHHLSYGNVTGLTLPDGTLTIIGRELDEDLVPLICGRPTRQEVLQSELGVRAREQPGSRPAGGRPEGLGLDVGEG